MTIAADRIQVLRIDDTTDPNQEYGDYRGLVIEVDGVWEANVAGDESNARKQVAQLLAVDVYDVKLVRSEVAGDVRWDVTPVA